MCVCDDVFLYPNENFWPKEFVIERVEARQKYNAGECTCCICICAASRKGMEKK